MISTFQATCRVAGSRSIEKIERSWAFVRLMSFDDPFDRIWATEVDRVSGEKFGGEVIEWDNLQFRLVRRFDDGRTSVVRAVEPVE